jgi:adenylate cyclase
MTAVTGEQLCWRTAKRVGLWTIVANLDGAAFTFAYLAFLVPVDQPTGRDSLTLDVVMLIVFLVVSIFVIGKRIDNELRRDLGWVIEERAPTDDERDATLALPFRLSALPLIAWLLAAVLWGVCGLLIDLTAGQAAHVAVSIALGGLVTSLIAYLLNERQCRPLFVLALADGGRPTRPTSTHLGAGVGGAADRAARPAAARRR